jgi:hypothetical protein
MRSSAAAEECGQKTQKLQEYAVTWKCPPCLALGIVLPLTAFLRLSERQLAVETPCCREPALGLDVYPVLLGAERFGFGLIIKYHLLMGSKCY